MKQTNVSRNSYRSRKVNIPDMEITLGMLCTVFRHHYLQVFGQKKRKQRMIYLCSIQCSIGRGKRVPKSHARYAAKGKGATRHKLQQGNF